MLELTLALHTLCTDPEHQCLCRHRALAQQPSCLGKKQTLPGDEYGSRGCCWAVVVSPSATDATTDTQRGHNRWYTQDNILQHCSSSKRQLRARLSPCQTAPRTALPMPSPKPNLIDSWGGWRWPSACRGVSVRRRGDTTTHCPHPFRPFCSALRFCFIFRGHTRVPHASRQPCLYHTVGRSCDHIQMRQSARHLPSLALLVSPEPYC